MLDNCCTKQIEPMQEAEWQMRQIVRLGEILDKTFGTLESLEQAIALYKLSRNVLAADIKKAKKARK